MARFVYPVFGALSVQAVDTGLVLKVIEPLWTVKTETASRVRGRIEAVLDWAAARGYRQGDNPARWRGHLDHLLPARSKVRQVKHHAALPYHEMGAFMTQLRQQDGIAARAFEFLILTCARTDEVVDAPWSEVDFGNRMWIIPAERMKGRREHRVPLSDTALAILDRMRQTALSEEFIFASNAKGPINNMSMLMLLRRMTRARLTVHGFRSTFRDWVAERTNFPAEVAEMALAHAVGDKVEAAYRRGNLLEKRRQLGQAWANFCGRDTADRTRNESSIRPSF
jgi:integrase